MKNEDLPPPAYSEQEFDQKISVALDASLTVPQPSAIQTSEEVWEEWNESTFETAARAVSGKPESNQPAEGSTSQLVERYPLRNANISARFSPPANIEPLRIHKKSASVGKSGLSKTYFDGYREDPNGGSSTYSSQANAKTDRSSQLGIDHRTPESTRHTTQTIHHDVPLADDEEHDFSLPPPPFSPAEPNPDGTPIVIMSYNPETSPPPSPLISPNLPHVPLPDHHYGFPQTQPQPGVHYEGFVPRHRLPRQSLPAPPRSSNNQFGKRPATTLGPKSMQMSEIPRMNFNPSVAYNKQSGLPQLLPAQHAQTHVQTFNANAFYNSAVSAHLPHSHTMPSVGAYGQQPRTSYHPSSGYDPGIGQIQQPSFYGQQHTTLPDRGSANVANHGYQNPTNYTASQHPTYFRR